MYVSPKHPDYERLSRPPEPPEDGEVLAALPRSRREELRVALAEYEGHPYISLRVWAPGADGRPRPVRGKGCSIRIREVADVIGALRRAAELAAFPMERPAAAAGSPHVADAAAGPFDEFDESGDSRR
jgi:hypothetical protein